ncbi:MAG: Gfo/Idh/MocA family oxidoreductase [Ruminococcaceae bacterium]|nr:Gfo/Idh/MocA family oxidoreductase [Oscillospiraceae bacterium]
MRKIKWGIIGCGGIADRRTLPGMMLAENAQCYAVMDANKEAAERVKEKYGVRYAFTDFNELLKLDEIEAVYIASPVFAHKEQAYAAAKAKKHILLEKPLGLTLQDSIDIIELCEKEGVKLGVGLMMRYHAYHQAIKKLISDGVIGDIVSMRAQFTCWYPKIENCWRQDKSLSGGGALMDMGIHCIDLLQYVSGLEAVECTGYAYNQTFGYNADDSAAVIMRMSNGALAYVDSNFNIPDAAAKCPLEFYGTKGSITAVGTLAQEEGGTVEILAADDSAGYDAQQNRSLVQSRSIKVEFGNMYTKEIEAFSDAVINDTEPPVNGRNTILVQKVIDAIYNNNGGKL